MLFWKMEKPRRTSLVSPWRLVLKSIKDTDQTVDLQLSLRSKNRVEFDFQRKPTHQSVVLNHCFYLVYDNIFMGGARVGTTSKSSPPRANNSFLYPPPLPGCFMKDTLITPITTITQSPHFKHLSLLPPPLNFDRTHTFRSIVHDLTHLPIASSCLNIDETLVLITDRFSYK